MTTIRELPLKENFDIIALIKAVEERGYTCEPLEGGVFTVNDIHVSNFYFKITKAKLNPNGMQEVIFSLTYFPASNTELTSTGYDGKKFEQVLNYLDNWIALTNAYEKTPFYKDLLFTKKDSIIEQYEAEAFQEFKLLDEDADTHSFPLAIQLEIENYIENTVKKLEAHREKIQDNSQEKMQLNDVLEDLNNLRATQTHLTKNQLLLKLSTIVAKGRKIGLDVWKVVWPELIKMGLKELAALK